MSNLWPSFNSANFSKFHTESPDKRISKKLSLYISTEDNTPQQVIKKDRSNILIRYLYQQLDKKNMKRRTDENQIGTSISQTGEGPRSKVPRTSQFQSSASNSASLESALDNAAAND